VERGMSFELMSRSGTDRALPLSYPRAVSF
jgi:hypothetical protein